MNFKEYTKEASKTAFYPEHVEDFRMAYLALKMCGEFGELAYAIQTKVRVNIIKEIGDLLWYLSQFMYINALEITPYTTDPNTHTVSGLLKELRFNICLVAEYVGKTYRDFDGRIYMAFRNVYENRCNLIFIALNALVTHYGITLEDVMKINLEKLADRQRKGVLGGSGDNR